MSDITAFLSARLDETERAAELAAQITDWTDFALGLKCEGVNADIASPLVHQQSPSRVLREVESGRKILAMYRDAVAEAGSVTVEWLLAVVETKAAVYREHPDYDPAWAV